MSHVYVKQIYVTNLDRVVCTGEYELAENPFSTGTYQSCEVPCHSECVGGCNKKEDSRACMECENHKLFYSGARFDCISECGLTPAVLYSYFFSLLLCQLIISTFSWGLKRCAYCEKCDFFRNKCLFWEVEDFASKV